MSVQVLAAGSFGIAVGSVLTAAGGRVSLLDEATSGPRLDSDTRPIVFALSGPIAAYVERLSNCVRVLSAPCTFVAPGSRDVMIGPLLRPGEAPCLSCCLARYASDPGDPLRGRWEALARERWQSEPPVVRGFTPAMARVAAVEAERQLRDRALPTGFWRKIDWLEFDVWDSTVTPIHGCECKGVEPRYGATALERLRAEVRDIMNVGGERG